MSFFYSWYLSGRSRLDTLDEHTREVRITGGGVLVVMGLTVQIVKEQKEVSRRYIRPNGFVIH